MSEKDFSLTNACWEDRDQLSMGESFQDYSWIQDFEADFPKKISLKMLN